MKIIILLRSQWTNILDTFATYDTPRQYLLRDWLTALQYLQHNSCYIVINNLVYITKC